MSKRPNQKEAALIAEMQKALERHMKYDTRDPGFYFEHGTETVFQNLAHQVAVLIKKQRTQGTCKTLLSVAKKIKELEDIEWNNANSIGFAFRDGLGADAILATKANPFAKMKFPKP